jgi:methionyl-tRNA formyltransferase
MTSAVVFAYHNVGARCLRVLLAHGVDVPLVVTHADDPGETLWFERVADVADDYGIGWIAPDDAGAGDVAKRLRALAPDFLFSFYYRRMLPADILGIPSRGALNMHGSLLPKYRGRAPVNWAVLHGERETGASLHYMAAKPDAGDLVAQTTVPILPDDTAREVFDKVTVAAECTLDRAMPGLIAGTAPRQPLDLARGSYYGGRKPEDGRIDWSQDAARIHNLVRAVAPPYPGAIRRRRGSSRAHPALAGAPRRRPAAAADARRRRRLVRRPLRRRRHAARQGRGGGRRACGAARACRHPRRVERRLVSTGRAVECGSARAHRPS